MPTYIVLGGTGSTGSAVLRTLHASPPADLSLRILVRSISRLLTLLPFLSSSPSDTPHTYQTTIIEGSFSDSQTLETCLRNADVIFSCIASNDSSPGISIALDTAAAIISTLKALRSKEKTYTKPTILMLSTGSINPVFAPYFAPKPIKVLLDTALHYNYSDLRRAESLYRDCLADDPDLLSVLFVQPPATMPGLVPTGYELSTRRMSRLLSFADLGAGMVELGNRCVGEGGEWEPGSGISVVATGKVAADWGPNTRFLGNGLVAYLLPWV